jgi:hypothetical protein
MRCTDILIYDEELRRGCIPDVCRICVRGQYHDPVRRRCSVPALYDTNVQGGKSSHNFSEQRWTYVTKQSQLGINWAATLIAGLSLLLSAVPFIFYKYGPRIRSGSRFAPCMVSPGNSSYYVGEVLTSAQDLKIAKELAAEREKEREEV